MKDVVFVSLDIEKDPGGITLCQDGDKIYLTNSMIGILAEELKKIADSIEENSGGEGE